MSALRALLSLMSAMTALPVFAAPTCEYSELAVVPISFPGNGAHAAMAGQINDKPVQMMVDTGAQKTMLVKAEAERQGLPEVLQNDVTAGIGGGVSMYTTRVDRIVIGPAEARYTRLAIIDSLSRSDFGAIVGADFLFQSDLEIAFGDRQLKFFKADGCDDKWLAYWDPKAGKIATRSSGSDRRPVFEVLLNGVKVRAIIDTGAPVSMVDLRTAARAGVTMLSPGAAPAGTVGGIGHDRVPQWRATFASFAIGNETIAAPRIRFTDMVGQAPLRGVPEMLLGRDFLMTHHVLLAASQDSLYFTYLGGEVFH